MITILTWLWQQRGCRTTYTADHVNIWADMIRRHVDMPHRIACVTDNPAGIDSRVSIIRPPGDFDGMKTSRWTGEKPSCYRRLAMFRPDAAEIFGDRFVQIDLDVVIGGSLDPVLDRPEDIVLFRGTSGKRPYNGSMTLMTAGVRPKVFTDFTPTGAEEASRMFVGSDQAWMMKALGPGEATWGEEHGVWWYGSMYQKMNPDPKDVSVLFYPGRVKPWTSGHNDPYTRHYYKTGEKADFPALEPYQAPVPPPRTRQSQIPVRRTMRGPRRA